MNLDKTSKEWLEKRVHELEMKVRKLERSLIHDPLTELKTRSFFEKKLNMHLAAINHKERRRPKARIEVRNVSIIFFDIDYFKNVNDTYGHDVGDVVLRKVAKTIELNLRTSDTSARWGGEEMVAVLLQVSEAEAMAKAEEIRAKVEALVFPEAPDLRLTVSAGVASFGESKTLSELVKRADRALYAAKNAGRNKVAAYSEIAPVKVN